jgi:peptide/nickel transport system substrate-binding protein
VSDPDEDLRRGSSTVRRRRFLAAAGAGLSVGVAGCSGTDGGDGGDGGDGDGGGDGNDSGNGSDGGGGGGSPVDPNFTGQVWNVPENYQWNPYNQSTPYPGTPVQMVHPALNKPNKQTGNITPWVASDWGKEGGKYVISLADRVTGGNMPFHDGEGALDAEDVATKFKLDTYLEYAPANFTSPEKIQAGDGRVEIELEKDFNEAILNERFANYRLDAPHHVFEEYLQKLQDASSEDETTSAREDLTTFGLAEPAGCGPFRFESVDAQSLVLAKFEDHPIADEINWEKADFVHVNSANQGWQALRGEKLDGITTWFTPEKVAQEYADYIMEIFIPANWGMGIGFNADNKHYSRRNVRKAVAYALNRDAIAKNSGGDSKAGVGTIGGIPGTMQEAPRRILGEDNIAKLEDYGVEPKPEEAATHMEEAGYTKENGKWTDQDGEVPQFPMKVPAGFSDWVSGTQTTVSQINQFGFNAEMVTVEGSSFWTQWTDGDFKVMAMAWTVGNTVPYLNFNYQLRNSEITDNANWNVENAKVPPLGEPDADLQNAEINQNLDQLAKTAVDADDYQQRATAGAWLTNQLLWRMPLQEKLDQSWYTTDHWNVPSADSDKHQVNWPQPWHVRTGDLQARME